MVFQEVLIEAQGLTKNFDVFTKTIAVNFIPSLLEPILYLLAFGYGLGGFIPSIRGQSYITFIAPALVAISIMNGSFFECTFASFVRMYFQKTFDAIVATLVSVDEVVAGELLWGATRATINTTIVLAVVAAFGLISSPLFLLVIPFAFSGDLCLPPSQCALPRLHQTLTSLIFRHFCF